MRLMRLKTAKKATFLGKKDWHITCFILSCNPNYIQEGDVMLSSEKYGELTNFTAQIRIKTIEQLATCGFGHLGGSMSIAELIGTLYGGAMNINPEDPQWEDRDWLICSKGHAGPTIYSALALKGYFPMEWLDTLNKPHTNLPSHCDRNKTPGIDMTTGSLGQGLSVAAGIALGHKMDQQNNYIFCIIGDGESQEGQNWEAALFSAQQKLDHLILFIDNNKVQLDGATSNINNVESFTEKFTSFGWNATRVNGHDCGAIYEAIEQAKAAIGKPAVIVLDTEKGKGCSFAEGKFNHHITVSREQAEDAISLLQKQIS